jgi:glutathione S-transferase
VHSRDEIYSIGNKNLQAISDFLGNKKFMMGDEPSQVDASMFGILSSTLWIPVEFPSKEYAYKNCPNLHFYLLRLKERFYADTIEPWYTGGPLAEDLMKIQSSEK